MTEPDLIPEPLVADEVPADVTPTEPEPEPEDEPDPQYDPATQVMTEDGKVQAMPSGAWTAALTPAGNLRRRKGLLVLAP